MKTVTSSDNSRQEPEFLYRYYRIRRDSIDWTKRIFTHHEVYFPSPNQFNDPYDSRVRPIVEGTRAEKKIFFRKAAQNHDPALSSSGIGQKAKYAMDNIDTVLESLDREFQDRRQKIGVFCMSQKRDNILMWSHYSDSHEGFCLEFSVTNEFFARVEPVIYVEDVPKLNILHKDVRSELADILLQKAKDWEYEAEWRIIDIQQGPGKKQFPSEALTGIILGARIPNEDKKNILEWCSDFDASPKIYEAKMDADNFRLNIYEAG